MCIRVSVRIHMHVRGRELEHNNVYLSVCVHVHVHVYLSVCVHVHVHVYLSVCVHVHVHVEGRGMYACMCTTTSNL